MAENINLADPVVQVLTVLLGIVILVAGRKLFWVTVGVAGFIFGLYLTFNVLQDQPTWLTLIVALIIGVIGAFVAIILQKAAVALAGLLIGGYLFASLLVALAPNLAQWQWIAFIVGGIIGFVLMVTLFDVTLVILSALLGAALIVQVLKLQSGVGALIFIILVIVGIVIQWRILNPPPAPPPPSSPPISQRAKRTR